MQIRTKNAHDTADAVSASAARYIAVVLALFVAAGWFGFRHGSVEAAPNAAPPASPAVSPAGSPATRPLAQAPELTTLRVYGDTVLCDECATGQANRPASAGSDSVVDPNTGRVPEDAPYTDPQGPFDPASAEAPRHDFVTWNPAFISERLGEAAGEWACLDGPDEVSATSAIRAGGVNAAQKVWLRHWYEPTRLDKDLNADDCLTDLDGDGEPDAAPNPDPSNTDEWYPAIMTELTYLLVENEFPRTDVSGDEVHASAPRPFCGAAGATRMVLPVGTFAGATDPGGPEEGQGLTSLDYDFDGAPDMVNVTSERALADRLGLTIDFDGDAVVDDIDPAGPLSCDAMVVLRTDATTIGVDDQLQLLDHFVRLNAAGGGSATLEIWYNGDLLPRLVANISIGDGSAVLAGDVGPIPPQDRIGPGGDNLGTVPSGPWFVYVDGVDAVDNTATLILGRALGAPCASMESAPNTPNRSAGGPWHLKRFYVDGHEYNVTGIMSCDADEFQYMSIRAPLPKVPTTIEQHSVRLQPYEPLDYLPLPPPFNHEHTVLEDVVLAPSDTIGPCPVGGLDPDPLQPEPRPEIRYSGGPIGPLPPIMTDADGLTYSGRDPARPVGPYEGFEFFIGSRWLYVDEDVNRQLLGQLREKHGAELIDPNTGQGVREGFFYNEQMWTRPWNFTEFYLPDRAGPDECAADAYYMTSGFVNETARSQRWSMPDGPVPDQVPPTPPDLIEEETGYEPTTGAYGTEDRARFVHDPDLRADLFTSLEGVRLHGGWPRCPDGDCDEGALARPDIRFGAGDVSATDPAGYPVEVPPYTDPFAPFNPQAPDAPRGDSLTFNPAYLDEFRNFGEPLRALYQQLSNMAMNAREKVYHRAWYQPDYVTKIRTVDDCDRDLSFPAVMQEFTYLMMDTTDHPVAVPVPGSRIGFPVATHANGLPRPDPDGDLPETGTFGHGLTTFDADFDGYPEAVSLHTEQSLAARMDEQFQAHRPRIPGVPVLPLPGPVVDFDGDGVTDTLDADCVPLNGNELVVLAAESIVLDTDPDTTEGHAAMFLDHLVAVDNITAGDAPAAQLRFFFTGGTISEAVPERVGGSEALKVGSVAIVDRFQDNVRVVDAGETNLGRTDGAWFAFVEDVSEDGERVVLTVGRALGGSHSAIDDGFGDHDLAPGDPWYLKRFYVDGHEYNVVAVGTATGPGADPLDGGSCNDHFTFLSIRTPVPKGNFFNPQDSLFQQGYFLDGLPSRISVMPPFNVRHTIAQDIERLEADEFGNVNAFDSCVGPLAAAAPLAAEILAEEPEERFSNGLREIYRPGGLREPSDGATFDLDGWETALTALTPSDFTQLGVPEGQRYLLTLAWESRASRLSFYGCTHDAPGPFDDEEDLPGLDHAELAGLAAAWDPGLVPPVNRSTPPRRDGNENGIQDIVPFYDARCADDERVRVKIFYDPSEDDDLYVNERPVDLPFVLLDVRIDKDAVQPTPIAGDVIEYRLTVTNDGPDDAPFVRVTDTLPEQVRYLSDDAGCTVDDGPPQVLTCEVGPLPAGDATVISVRGFLDPATPAGTILENVARVEVPFAFDLDPDNNVDRAITETARDADLQIDKSALDPDAVAGADFRYRLTVTNLGPSHAEGVVISDTLPTDATFVSTDRPGDCSRIGTVVRCEIGDLAAGDTVEIVLTVRWDRDIPAGERRTNGVEVGSDTPDSDPSDNDDQVETILRSVADLSMIKTGTPDTVTAGERLTYTIRVENGGPSDATSVRVTDTLPSEVRLVSTSGATCSGVPVGGTGTLVCQLGTVPVGTVREITIVVEVDPATPDGTVLRNRAVTGTDAADDPAPDDNGDDDETDVITRAALSIEKDAPGEVMPSEVFDWIVRVTNGGPSDARDVAFVDTLPDGTTFVEAVGASCTGVSPGGTGTLTCELGTVPAGTSVEVTIRLRVHDDAADGDVLTNAVVVDSTTPDSEPSDNSTDDTSTVRRLADLVLAKSGPARALAGQRIAYAVRVDNLGPSTATDVVVTDTLPAGTTWVPGGPCTLPSGSMLTCALPDLAAGATTTIPITVDLASDIPHGTILRNSAGVTTTAVDENSSNNVDDHEVLVERAADLRIVKSDDPDPVVAGTSLTYTLQVFNDGPSDADAVRITDTLPAGTTFDGPVAGCSETTPGVVACDVGTIAAGGSATVVLVVDVDSDVPGGTVIVNRARVGSPTDDPDSANNEDTESTTVIAESDLSLAKDADPVPAVAGAPMTYTLIAENLGPSVATGVQISDTLPAGVTVLTLDAGCASSPGNVVVCSIGTLDVGQSVTRTLVVRPDSALPPGSQITNVGAVDAAVPDPDPANNEDEVTVGIATSADLSISKRAPETAEPGQRIVYEIAVTNDGPSAARGAVVTDTLPTGVSYVSATGASCTEGPVGTLVCDVGEIAVGATETFQIEAELDGDLIEDTVLNNTVIAGSDTDDPDPTNNEAQDSTRVRLADESDLRLTKISTDALPGAGEQFAFELEVFNAGPRTATNLLVTDTLPSGLTYVSDSDSCSPSGQVLTCQPGPLLVGASTTFAITVEVVGDVPAGTRLTNHAITTAELPDPNPSDNEDTAAVEVTARADVRIDKSAPPVVAAGELITWTVTAENAGPSPALLTVTDTLPSGVTYIADDAGCDDSNPPQLVCALGELAAGTSQDIHITALIDSQLPDGTVLRNIAVVGTPVVDPVPGNESAETSTTVERRADLVVSKSASPDPATAGESVTWTLRVENIGPSLASGVVVTDTLPDGVEYRSDSAGCDATDAPTIVCTLGNLGAGGVVAFTIRSDVDPSLAAGTLLTNTAIVVTEALDPDPSNNEAQSVVATLSVPSLSISKTGHGEVVLPGEPPTLSVVENQVTAGQQLTYTLTVNNGGPSTASALTVVDTMPNGLTMLSWSPDCSASDPLTLQCLPSELLPGDSLQVVVTGSVDPSVADGTVLTNVATTTAGGASSLDAFEGARPTALQQSRAEAAQDTIVSAVADLSISKRASAAEVAVGDLVTYTLAITNSGPSWARDVAVRDPLGPSLQLEAMEPGCVAEAGGVTCTLQELPVGASSQWQVVARVLSGAEGEVAVNLATVELGSGADPDLRNNSAEAGVTVLPSIDLVVAKRAVGETVEPGSPPLSSLKADRVTAGRSLTYTLVVTNVDASPAIGGRITDTLPSGVTLASVDPACSSGSAGTLVCDLPTLNPGGSAEFVLTVDVPSNIADGALLTNNLSATADGVERTPANNVTQQDTLVERASDLTIAKSASRAAVDAGEAFTYTVVVGNVGPSAASAVRLTDTLPISVTAISLPAGCSPVDALVFVCDLGTMSPASLVELEIPVRVETGLEGTEVVNTAVVGIAGGGLDPDPSNNMDEASVLVRERAELSLDKFGIGEVVTASSPPQVERIPNLVTAGKRLTWTLAVNNTGPSTAVNSVLTDVLPADVMFVTSIGPSCATVGGHLECALGDIPSGGSVEVDLVADVGPGIPDGTDLINRAGVRTDTREGMLADNQAEHTTTVLAQADLAITKLVRPSVAVRGESLTFTLAASNLGPSLATDVLVTDTLPTGVIHVSDDHGCDTAFLPELRCSIARLDPGEEHTIRVVVRSLAPGEETFALDATPGRTSVVDDGATVGSALPAQTPQWPPFWVPLTTDPPESGCAVHRDATDTFFAQDPDYLYLRQVMTDDAGWPASSGGRPTQARYKWWFDTTGGDAFVSGTSVRDAEWMLMLEDLTGQGDAQGSRDQLGELTLMDDLTNLGFSDRWGSGLAYLTGVPAAGPAATGWRRVLGQGVPGLGGPQAADQDVEIGYRLFGNTVDMYVSWDALGDPNDVFIFWATDVHNNNLDQAPDCDRPAGTSFVGTNRTMLNRTGVSWPGDDPDGSNNTASARAELVSPFYQADLSVTKSAESTVPAAGAPLTYTVRITNTGPVVAARLVLTDVLTASDPTAVQLTDSDPPCALLTSRTMRCDLADLDPTASTTVTVYGEVLSLPPDGSLYITNTARVRSDIPDPNGADNQDSSFIELVGGAFGLVADQSEGDSVTLQWRDVTTVESEFVVQARVDDSPYVQVDRVLSQTSDQTGRVYSWRSPRLPANHAWEIRVVASGNTGSGSVRVPSVAVRIVGPERPRSASGCYDGILSLDGRSRHDGVVISIDGMPTAMTDMRGRFLACGATTGYHLLGTHQPGYVPVRGSVEVKAGESRRLPWIPLPGGDVDGDAAVALPDLAHVAARQGGSTEEHIDFGRTYDLNADGRIDRMELVITSAHYGLRGPLPWTERAGAAEVLAVSPDGVPMLDATEHASDADAAAVDGASTAAAGGTSEDDGGSRVPVDSREPVPLAMRQTTDEGGRAVVTVSALGVRDVFGADLLVTWDPSEWRLVDTDDEIPGSQVRPGDPWFTDGDPFVAMNEIVGTDRHRLVVVRQGTDPSLKGDVPLAEVVLAPRSGMEVAEGAAPLQLRAARLVNRQGRTMPVQHDGVTARSPIDWTRMAVRRFFPSLQR